MKLTSTPIMASIAVAGIGFVLGAPFYLVFRDTNVEVGIAAMNATIWLGWLWIITFLVAAYTDGWRSLWLLLVAPLALGWPSFLILSPICHPWGGCILDG
jgi:hypothetical protein